MAYDFKLPDLGEGIHEGEIKKWLVKEGDKIGSDQPMAEIETDKAVVEMPSPKGGTVLKIYAKEGERVKVGQTIITIGTEGEQVSEPAKQEQQPAAKPMQKPSTVVQAKTEVQPAPISVIGGQVLATPYVRKLARELGIDITKIRGSGAGGRITEEDLKKPPKGQTSETLEQPKTVEASAMQSTQVQPAKQVQHVPIIIEGEVEKVPFRGLRRKVAEHMVTSMQSAMHVTHMDEIDVSQLAEIRQREKEIAAKSNIHLTFLPFIIKAAIAALREYPYFNASLDEEKEEIVLKKYYNIGIAVDTEEGLMVPVIKNAQNKTILQIAREISELSEKARTRKIALEELRGGSFTITNIGSIGGNYATPIINYPEVAILGIYKMQDKSVVREGVITIRKMFNLSVTFDHRIVDGAAAARFMNAIKKHLEDPGLLLVDE